MACRACVALRNDPTLGEKPRAAIARRIHSLWQRPGNAGRIGRNERAMPMARSPHTAAPARSACGPLVAAARRRVLSYVRIMTRAEARGCGVQRVRRAGNTHANALAID